MGFSLLKELLHIHDITRNLVFKNIFKNFKKP